MRYFNKVTFGMEFRAVRSIKAGEELFTYYTDPVIHTSSRQEDLKPYGFQCGCESCRTPSDSDFVRMQLYRNTPMLVDYKRLVVFLMTPGLPESYVVDHSLQQLELIERTGLEGSEFYSSHLKFLVEAYCAVENLQKALIYLRKLEDFKRAESGGEEKSVKTLMQMVKEHPRWGWKTKIQGAMEVAGFYAHCSSVL
ncbi:hypothetical protein E1B28_005634 [Marasmius oreades]|uniref:SET domain-containing protein n=1 Tax=Marasmius oreades TaxID=181124 RepID=A0A9P7S500_9AGAR|nr:uncharacterized protein E1B28_005634 [Marasmius oreades]KAG7094821.1 hypothetical protein E1B28_005634 [Marasmius oreades]